MFECYLCGVSESLVRPRRLADGRTLPVCDNCVDQHVALADERPAQAPVNYGLFVFLLALSALLLLISILCRPGD